MIFLLDSLKNCNCNCNVTRNCRITQSVGATGGVYKGLGRNQHELMTRACKEFLAQDKKNAIIYPHHDAQCRLPNLFGQGYKLVECISVARVQPRTSKGHRLKLPCVTHTLSLQQVNKKEPYQKPFSRLRSRSLTELTKQLHSTNKERHGTTTHNDDNTKDRDDDTTRHNTTQRRNGTSHSTHHTEQQPPTPPPQPTTKNKQQQPTTTKQQQQQQIPQPQPQQRTRAKR